MCMHAGSPRPALKTGMACECSRLMKEYSCKRIIAAIHTFREIQELRKVVPLSHGGGQYGCYNEPVLNRS